MAETGKSPLSCVLLVDDDAFTNTLNLKILRVAKVEAHIEITQNGQEALDYLTCTGRYAEQASFPQPGIILLDMNMPVMDGWEFLEKYHDLDEHQKARIVVAMLTTSLNANDRQKALGNGDVMAYLNKPLTIENIRRLVDENFAT